MGCGCVFLDYKDIKLTYRTIEDGKWMTVHTLAPIVCASARSTTAVGGMTGSVKGVGKFCIDCAFEQCGKLRVNTHGMIESCRPYLKKWCCLLWYNMCDRGLLSKTGV